MCLSLGWFLACILLSFLVKTLAFFLGYISDGDFVLFDRTESLLFASCSFILGILRAVLFGRRMEFVRCFRRVVGGGESVGKEST
jgi:hypothetical protein